MPLPSLLFLKNSVGVEEPLELFTLRQDGT